MPKPDYFEPTYVRYNGRTDCNGRCSNPSLLIKGAPYLAVMKVHYDTHESYVLKTAPVAEFCTDWFDILPTITPTDPLGNPMEPGIDLSRLIQENQGTPTTTTQERDIEEPSNGNKKKAEDEIALTIDASHVDKIIIKGGKVYDVTSDNDVLSVEKIV